MAEDPKDAYRAYLAQHFNVYGWLAKLERDRVDPGAAQILRIGHVTPSEAFALSRELARFARESGYTPEGHRRHMIHVDTWEDDAQLEWADLGLELTPLHGGGRRTLVHICVPLPDPVQEVDADG